MLRVTREDRRGCHSRQLNTHRSSCNFDHISHQCTTTMSQHQQPVHLAFSALPITPDTSASSPPALQFRRFQIHMHRTFPSLGYLRALCMYPCHPRWPPDIVLSVMHRMLCNLAIDISTRFPVTSATYIIRPALPDHDHP
jgi:hypothetical protein